METCQPINTKIINEVKISRLEVLGEGSYGTVSSVGENLAFKEFNHETDDIDYSTIKEISTYQLLEMLELEISPKVEQVILSSECRCGLIMKKYPNTLNSLTHLDNGLKIVLVQKLLQNYCTFAGVGLSHCDIKPSNIVVDLNDGDVRFIDWGSSKFSRSMNVGANGCTLWYCSPEILLSKINSDPIASDIWSLGMTIWNFFDPIGFKNMHGGNRTEMLFSIFRQFGTPSYISLKRISGDFSLDTTIFPKFPTKRLSIDTGNANLDHLIGLMLTIDPTQRVTLENMRLHPFIEWRSTSCVFPVRASFPIGTSCWSIVRQHLSEWICLLPKRLAIRMSKPVKLQVILTAISCVAEFYRDTPDLGDSSPHGYVVESGKITDPQPRNFAQLVGLSAFILAYKLIESKNIDVDLIYASSKMGDLPLALSAESNGIVARGRNPAVINMQLTLLKSIESPLLTLPPNSNLDYLQLTCLFAIYSPLYWTGDSIEIDHAIRNLQNGQLDQLGTRLIESVQHKQSCILSETDYRELFGNWAINEKVDSSRDS